MNKSELSRALLQTGLAIRPQALDALSLYLQESLITDLSSESFEAIQTRLSEFQVIDLSAVESLYEGEERKEQKRFMVILNVVRDLAHFRYSAIEANFVSRRLSSVPDEGFSCIDMMTERLSNIRAVLSQNDLFTASERLYAPRREHIDLITVDALVGSIGEKCVLGVISRKDENSWGLEDGTEFVKLNLKDADRSLGYFPAGCVVLVQGEYQDGLLNVSGICHPPTALTFSLKNDLFGTSHYLEQAKSDDPKVIPLGENSKSLRFVVLADVHLDDYSTLAKLRVLFEGYAGNSNLVFVLLGDFLTFPTFDSQPYQDGFSSLYDLISIHENLREKCYWILIPGPNDIGLGGIYPKDCLGDTLTEPLSSLQHFISSSNPTRVEVCGKRMVFFCVDLIRKLRRNSAVPPTTEEHSSTHLANTVLKQAHLTPGRDVTTMWELDDTLRLLPIPDLLCYGDKCAMFVKEVEGCLMFNPGSFTHDSSFVFVNAMEKQAEECSIPSSSI